MLYGQLARHGKASWDNSRQAYDSIATLTDIYNHGINNNDKWNGIMDFKPREQPVFAPLKPCESYAEPVLRTGKIIEARFNKGDKTIEHFGLGISGHAIEIPNGKSAIYHIPASETDSITVKLNFLPNHPVNESEGLKFAVSLNNGNPYILDYSTKGRSEEWKENILNGRATETVVFHSSKNVGNELKITAMTDGIILDHIEILN